jgi:hypothetical protein
VGGFDVVGKPFVAGDDAGLAAPDLIKGVREVPCRVDADSRE